MITTTDLRVRSDFADACPKLTPDERKQLEANILADGIVRAPICVWRGYIVDGHHRFEIAKKHDIPFGVERLDDELADEAAVFEWIKNNALGQRNLTAEQKSLLRGRQYNAAKGTRGGDRRSKGNGCTLNAAKQVAEANGVSERTVKADGKKVEAFDKADESTQQQYLDGEISGAELQAKVGAMPHDPPGTAEDFYAKILTSVSTKSQEHVKVSRAAIDELRDQFNRLVVVADRDGEDKLNLKTIDRHLKAAKREISRAQREIAELVKELRRREISG